MRVVPVEPTGTRRAPLGFVRSTDGGCRVEAVHLRDYPPSPLGAQLRRYRTAEGPHRVPAGSLVEDWPEHVSLGAAARALGVTAVELSNLETGRAILAPEDWRLAFDLVRALSRVPVEFGDVASILDSERTIGRSAGIGYSCDWCAGCEGNAGVIRFSMVEGWLPCCAACAAVPFTPRG